jgi:hypothetical protein
MKYIAFYITSKIMLTSLKSTVDINNTHTSLPAFAVTRFSLLCTKIITATRINGYSIGGIHETRITTNDFCFS